MYLAVGLHVDHDALRAESKHSDMQLHTITSMYPSLLCDVWSSLCVFFCVLPGCTDIISRNMF
jgi:hypothetical protein